jgi:CRISPR type III-A-associated protein Csm2
MPPNNQKKETDKKRDYLVEAKGYFPGFYEDLLQMEKSEDIDGLLECIKRLVETEGGGKEKKVTTHQLRNVYEIIRKAESPQTLKLARPKFAYIAARQKDGIRVLMALFDDLVRQIDTKTPKKAEAQKKSFTKFVEAIVAYQKYFEKITNNSKDETDS